MDRWYQYNCKLEGPYLVGTFRLCIGIHCCRLENDVDHVMCSRYIQSLLQRTKNTWTPENPNAKYPTYVWADQLGKRNYCRSSSMFAYNGNYIALRELSLSYKLPSILVQKAKLSNVELSITGQNLGYLTEAKHLFSP